jgi:hypothetical protein
VRIGAVALCVALMWIVFGWATTVVSPAAAGAGPDVQGLGLVPTYPDSRVFNPIQSTRGAASRLQTPLATGSHLRRRAYPARVVCSSTVPGAGKSGRT